VTPTLDADYTSPHRPGFRLLDIGDASRLAANDAYAEMRTLLDYRHRQQDGVSDHGLRRRTLSLDALEQLAADSYAQRNERMRNAWRHP